MDKERFPNKKAVEGQKADLTDANLTNANLTSADLIDNENDSAKSTQLERLKKLLTYFDGYW